MKEKEAVAAIFEHSKALVSGSTWRTWRSKLTDEQKADVRKITYTSGAVGRRTNMPKALENVVLAKLEVMHKGGVSITGAGVGYVHD